MKECLRCGKTTRTALYCQSCYSKLRKGVFTRNLKGKRDFKCEICDGVFHPASLDFHHPPEVEKYRTVSNLISRNDWDGARAEAEKCQMICASCHRVKHTTLTNKEMDEFDETKPVSLIKLCTAKHDEIVRLKALGKSAREVAEELGLVDHAINAYCRHNKIKSKFLGSQQDKYPEILERRKNGESYGSIAKAVGVCKRTTINVVRKFGEENE